MQETILNLKKLQQIAKKHGAYLVPHTPANHPLSDNPSYYNTLYNNLAYISPFSSYRFYSLETNKKLNNVDGVDWGGWFTFEELVDFLTAAEENRLGEPKYRF